MKSNKIVIIEYVVVWNNRILLIYERLSLQSYFPRVRQNLFVFFSSGRSCIVEQEEEHEEEVLF